MHRISVVYFNSFSKSLSISTPIFICLLRSDIFHFTCALVVHSREQRTLMHWICIIKEFAWSIRKRVRYATTIISRRKVWRKYKQAVSQFRYLIKNQPFFFTIRFAKLENGYSGIISNDCN